MTAYENVSIFIGILLKNGMWDLATAKEALVITPSKVITTTPGADNKKEM